LGQALALQRQTEKAREVLDKALALRRQIGDPRAEQTERLMARLLG
jgi:hypothetical protein